METAIPPICFFLALVMLFAGFAVWATEAPEADVELHKARVEGDQKLREAKEAQLRSRQRNRKLLMGSLFLGSVAFTGLAFWAMQPAESRRG